MLGGSCSTPFGITEGRHIKDGLDPEKFAGCSTPFGITEGRHVELLPDGIDGHTCSTPFGITEGRHVIRSGQDGTKGCAQRLSASRKVGTAMPWSLREVPSCAQRLSASRKVGTHPFTARAGRKNPVLNAFRHHGRSARKHCRLPGYSPLVLNAFRHQGRSAQTLNPSDSWRPFQCSTPFGITEGRHIITEVSSRTP